MNDTLEKILSAKHSSFNDMINRNGKLILCYGHFNIIHPGHMRYFKYARSLGDILVVALKDDSSLVNSEAKHYFKQDERAEGVSLLHIIDNVVILDEGNLEDFINQVKPDVLVMGSEHEAIHDNEIDASLNALKQSGGKVVYHAGETRYSTSELLYEGQDALSVEKLNLFQKACQNQSIEIKSINKRLDEIKDSKLLVIGDTIVDQYVACDALGMSAEAPVLVVRELDSREFIGGAAIVASHIRALGATCHYLSVVGKDEHARKVESKLKERGVNSHLIKDSSRPTTYKIRYMVGNQKLFRVSKLKEHKLASNIENKIIKKIKELAQQVDGILISDFVYGVVTEKILQTVQSIAKEYNLKLFGDIQCSSQMGKVTKFNNFNLVFPTEREARHALDNNVDGVEWIANRLMDELHANDAIVKLGADGFIAYNRQQDGFVLRQHYPALTVNPVDVAGAGDSLMAAMAASISSGSNLMEASAIGTCMAALAVREVGNQPISSEHLRNYINNTVFN